MGLKSWITHQLAGNGTSSQVVAVMVDSTWCKVAEKLFHLSLKVNWNGIAMEKNVLAGISHQSFQKKVGKIIVNILELKV
jgi:hypothetical protein